jgi:transposase
LLLRPTISVLVDRATRLTIKGLGLKTRSKAVTRNLERDIAVAARTLTPNTARSHRDDLVTTRTQTINRPHGLLTQLIPAGALTALSADTAAQLLRTVRPRTPMLRTLRALANDLIAEIRRLDRRITATATEITAAVQDSGSTLTQLHGIGNLLAAKILARAGDISRFRSATAFVAYTGTAPIEVSSGDVVRHRLSRAGDRQLNSCLHIMAITQIRHDTPCRTYYQRKRAAGKSHRETLRCLK